MLFDSLVHATPDGSWLDHNRYDASFERLLTEMDAVAPSRACLVNIAGYQNNDDLADFASQYPDRFVPVAGFDPSLSQAPAKDIQKLSNQKFPGIKLHPRLNGYDPLDPRCIQTIQACGAREMVVFLDSLFRRRGMATRHPSDVVDQILYECPDTTIILLHGGGAHLLDMFEMGRAHENFFVDISFTLTRYAGSSIDQDIRFMCSALDQKLTAGSDFPEYTPREARERLLKLMEGLPQEKQDNVLFGNLQRLFPA